MKCCSLRLQATKWDWSLSFLWGLQRRLSGGETSPAPSLRLLPYFFPLGSSCPSLPPSICACGKILAYVFVLVAKRLVVVFGGACLSVYFHVWRENGAQRAERRTEKRIRPWSRIDKDEKWKPAVVRARLHHILNSLNSILTIFKALEYNPHICEWIHFLT